MSIITEIIKERYIAEEGGILATDGEARITRDRRARELRRQGWKVKCYMHDFTDSARTRVYYLEAKRE